MVVFQYMKVSMILNLKVVKEYHTVTKAEKNMVNY